MAVKLKGNYDEVLHVPSNRKGVVAFRQKKTDHYWLQSLTHPVAIVVPASECKFIRQRYVEGVYLQHADPDKWNATK